MPPNFVRISSIPFLSNTVNFCLDFLSLMVIFIFSSQLRYIFDTHFFLHAKVVTSVFPNSSYMRHTHHEHYPHYPQACLHVHQGHSSTQLSHLYHAYPTIFADSHKTTVFVPSLSHFTEHADKSEYAHPVDKLTQLSSLYHTSPRHSAPFSHNCHTTDSISILRLPQLKFPSLNSQHLRTLQSHSLPASYPKRPTFFSALNRLLPFHTYITM